MVKITRTNILEFIKTQKNILFAICIWILLIGGIILTRGQSPAKPSLAGTPVNIKAVLSADKVDSFITANTISINSSAISPASLTVKINTTVTWVNNDTKVHTLKFTDGSASKTIAPHAVFTKKLTNPDTFIYYCSGISHTEGIITVTDTDFTKLKRGG